MPDASPGHGFQASVQRIKTQESPAWFQTKRNEARPMQLSPSFPVFAALRLARVGDEPTGRRLPRNQG